MSFDSKTAMAQYDQVEDSGAWDGLPEDDAAALRAGHEVNASRVQLAVEDGYARQAMSGELARDWGDDGIDQTEACARLGKRVRAGRRDAVLRSLGLGDMIGEFPDEMLREEVADASYVTERDRDRVLDMSGLDDVEVDYDRERALYRREANAAALQATRDWWHEQGTVSTRTTVSLAQEGATYLRRVDPAAARAAGAAMMRQELAIEGDDRLLVPAKSAEREFSKNLKWRAVDQLNGIANDAWEDMDLVMREADDKGALQWDGEDGSVDWDELDNNDEAYRRAQARLQEKYGEDCEQLQTLEDCINYYHHAHAGDWEAAGIAAQDILASGIDPYYDPGDDLETMRGLAPIAVKGIEGADSGDSDPALINDEDGSLANYLKYGRSAIDPDTGGVIPNERTCAKRYIANRLTHPDERSKYEPPTTSHSLPEACSAAGLNDEQAKALAILIA
ncbi:hypothetical protein [Bifidobacterium olomucense]|uniref:Uncharacterized protein n=1 Tax=Bifidobacterium olomucense TaxID=2675324 RepID=A0A7Y0HX31_9BIFI|nr:hypothetical protein [Bifidobacterium sp. DSM 109959]NMM97534.1 hypothetical protein [Bifidobacterium sp. DSM 109959]